MYPVPALMPAPGVTVIPAPAQTGGGAEASILLGCGGQYTLEENGDLSLPLTPALVPNTDHQSLFV